MPFNVGDRVLARNPLGNEAPGTVCIAPRASNDNVGVAFDHFCQGHNCDDHCTLGFGYFVSQRNLKPFTGSVWQAAHGTVFHMGNIFLEKLPIDQAQKIAGILNGYEYLLRPPLQNPPPTTDT